MANRLGRYNQLYKQLARPDNSSTIPRHVFVRAANANGDDMHRKGDRMNCFESTFVHLTERFNGKEVFLVGTLNQSNMLAQRTQKLIQEVKPDAVMVQCNHQWWNTAQMLHFVQSQEEMNGYSEHLDKYTLFRSFDMWSPTRSLAFWGRFRLYTALFHRHY